MMSELLSVIDDINKNNTLGEIGESIKRFVSSVDVNNPEVISLEEMKNWKEFCRDVKMSFWGGTEAEKSLNKIQAGEYEKIHEIIKVIPARWKKNKREVRGLKNKISSINFKHQVGSFGEFGFLSKPENFDVYKRNSFLFMHEVEKLKNKQKVFLNKKMHETSNSIGKKIAFYEDFSKNNFKGFYRLKPIDAAIVAARSHGLVWDNLNFIIVDFDYFENKFWTKEQSKYEFVSLSPKGSGFFSYQPRIYPATLFELSDSMKEVISNNDNLFDYFWVIAPSIDFNHSSIRTGNKWEFLCRDEVKEFSDENSAMNFIDMFLIKEDYFSPVLLGERDGMCYFLHHGM